MKIFSSLRRDLSLQLLVLYLLFVVPILFAGIIFDQFASQRLRNEITAADLSLARAIAQETNKAMEIALQSVRQLGEAEAVIEVDKEGMSVLFQQVQSVKPDINLIYRLDADGLMVFHHPLGPGSTVGRDFSFRGYFQRALETREPLVSLGRISPTTEQPVATTVMPLWRGSEFLGLVATNITLQSLSDTLSSIVTEHNPEENFQVLIIDAGGKVIGHPNSRMLLTDLTKKFPSVTEAVLSGNAGSVIEQDLAGNEGLYSYVPVSSAGWGVIVGRPSSVAFATLDALHKGVYFTVGTFLAIGLFFWWALSRRVIQPIERLSEYSKQLGVSAPRHEGSSHPLIRFTRRQDQLGNLIGSFIEMEEAIQARINELSTLVNTSTEVVSTLDSGKVLNRILEQLEQLLGIQMSAIVALDERREVFRAKATRGLSNRYAEQLIIDPNERISVTMRALRSGEPVQISDTESNPSYTAYRPKARAEGYRSILAIPLNTSYAPPSALVIYNPEPKEFSEREMDLLTSFANHATMAIENAELYSRSDARLQEQTRRLEALIQSMEDGLLLEDLGGRIIYINRTICDLAGLSADEIRDRSLKELFNIIFSSALHDEETQQALKAFLNDPAPQDISIAMKNGSGKRYFRVKGFTVTDSSSVLIGRGQILQDITKRHEVDRMKSSLIATVSHELRTPLAAIKGYATTLLAEDVKWDFRAQHEFLEIISLEADRLKDLVNNLLDVSRIEAGNLKLSKTVCRLEDLAHLAAERAYPSPGDRMTINLPSELPSLYVDPQRIESVLRNLIENAAKYSPRDAHMRLIAELATDCVIVHLEDEGPGIPLESQELIFSSFYRVENGLTRKTPGAGLGLAICRGFVQAHGGDIWLEPRAHGTCVSFSLPIVEIDRELGIEGKPELESTV